MVNFKYALIGGNNMSSTLNPHEEEEMQDLDMDSLDFGEQEIEEDDFGLGQLEFDDDYFSDDGEVEEVEEVEETEEDSEFNTDFDLEDVEVSLGEDDEIDFEFDEALDEQVRLGQTEQVEGLADQEEVEEEEEVEEVDLTDNDFEEEEYSYNEQEEKLDIDIDLDDEVTVTEEVVKDTGIVNENGEIVVMGKGGDAFEFAYVDIENIAIPQRIRKQVISDSLVTSIESNGLLKPIVLAPTSTEGLYVLIDGLRRLRACAKCGIKRIPSIINHKVTTAEIVVLEALYNHYTEYNIKEIIDYIEFLEKEKNILDQSTIEYLLQMEPGDYPKLKDILNDGDPDILDNLLNGKFTIDQAYSKLQKKRKGQSKEEKEQKKAQGAYDSEKEGVSDLESGEMAKDDPLSEEEIKELGMVPTEEELEEKSLDDLMEEGDNIKGYEVNVQNPKERTRLDPALRKAVLSKYQDTCQCCGVSGPAYQDVLDIHHITQVYHGGEDSIDNLIPVCLVCHKLIHKHGRGELYLPDKESLTDKEQERFKKIISYGNHIRKCCEKVGMKKEQLKKVDGADSIGRESYKKSKEK